MKYWIKRRENQQLGAYYIPCGQLSDSNAKRLSRSLYGENAMQSFETEKEYKDAIDLLRSIGANISPD